MIAMSDVAFGMGTLVAIILVAFVYALVGDRDVPAPTFTEHEYLTLVEPLPFYDWSADPDVNSDLTPPRGRDRPSIDDWVRAELSMG